MKNELISVYTKKACDAVKISFVSPLAHVTNYFDKEYRAEFVHQIFGENEKIFGYKDLEIKIVYSECSGRCLVKLRYSATTERMMRDDVGMPPDDVFDTLRRALPDDYCCDFYTFAEQQKLCEIHLTAFGIAKYQFACQTDDNNFRIFKAHLCSVHEDGFRQVHNRFQTLLLWYIDGANFIDLEDVHWEIIYLYTYPNGRNGPPSVCGFCTVYKFYAYPDQICARISQFIIFPPYQRCGVGIRFLNCVYNIIRDSIPNLKTITVEDPNEKFRMIKAINNVTTVLFSPVINQFHARNLENTDFVNDLTTHFKYNKKESYLIVDLITYIYANEKGCNDMKKRVIQRLKQRFQKRHICYRHSIRFNKDGLSSNHFRKQFNDYRLEFLNMVKAISSKIHDNMRLTKAK